ALAGSFNDQISDAILKITNPDLAAYNELLATQNQRIIDATAAGGDLNAVYQLNTLEQQQLTQQQQQADQQAAQAAADAIAQQVAATQTFNAGIADSIQKITDPNLAAYNELLA